MWSVSLETKNKKADVLLKEPKEHFRRLLGSLRSIKEAMPIRIRSRK